MKKQNKPEEMKRKYHNKDLNIAYNDGFQEGKAEARKEFLEMIENMIREINELNELNHYEGVKCKLPEEYENKIKELKEIISCLHTKENNK